MRIGMPELAINQIGAGGMGSNLPPSDIMLSNSTFTEGVAIGTQVGVLSFVDPGDTVAFSLVAGAGDTDNAKFAIDGTALETAVTVVGAGGSTFSVRVRATDAGGLTYEEAFVLTALSDGLLVYREKIVQPHRELEFALYGVLGYSVSLSGNTLAAGARGNVYNENWQLPPGDPDNWGTVVVYVKQGLNWVEQQILFETSNASYLGTCVAIDGDTLAATAPRNTTDENGLNVLADAGAAFVYTRAAGVWTKQQKLCPPAGQRGGGFGFGSPVNDFNSNQLAISGDTVIVGCKADSTDAAGANVLNGAGAAYVFHRTAGVWTLQQKLLSNIRQVAGNFGLGVAINGDTAVVTQSGNPVDVAAFVFVRVAGVWTLQQKISAPAGANNYGLADYGCSVSGDTLGICFNGDTLDVAGANAQTNAGSIRVYTRAAGVWTLQQKICPPFRTASDYFAQQISLKGDVLVAGNMRRDKDENGANTLLDAGMVWVYTRVAAVWSLAYSIKQPGRVAGKFFGSVTYDSGKLVIGCPTELRDVNDANPIGFGVDQSPGAIYIYE